MTSTLPTRSKRVVLLIGLLTLASPFALAQDDRLKHLRDDFAMRFLEPEPHMALAKYYLDHGDRLMAFNTLEAARRSRFEELVFNQAFQLTFRGFDYSPAAENTLLKEFSVHPQSEDVIFKLADIYIARPDWAKAKQYLQAGIKIRPDDFKFTGGLAEVLRIEGNKPAADSVIKDFISHYPESEEALTMKVEELIETDPARAKLLAVDARTKFPRSGVVAFDLGRIFHREGNLSEAEQLFVTAAELSPNSSAIQAWTGRFFFKVRSNKPRALDYYLNAYFLDPHTYETEYVESRIRNLSDELARAEVEKQTNDGTPLEKLLGDSNPVVVVVALGQMSEQWKPAYLPAVLKCLDHDDGDVRWMATGVIRKNADSTFDPKLKALLTDNDLRKRGLAAYLAVHRWKRASFPVIRVMLTHESELVRFDAVSALIMEGGEEGRRIAFAHAARERNSNLKKLIEKSKEEKSDQP